MAALCQHESLSYYMFLKPRTAKRLSWEVIPKAMDEYHQQLRAFPGQTPGPAGGEPGLAYPWRAGARLGDGGQLLVTLNLASVARAQDKDTLWGFIRRYAPDAAPESHPDLDQAAGFAVRYFRISSPHAETARAHRRRARGACRPCGDAETDGRHRRGARAHAAEYDSFSEELFMSVVRDTGKAHGFDNLRAWFKVLYEVLLGSDQGPRWGSFIALYGLSESVALIDRALAGDLA